MSTTKLISLFFSQVFLRRYLVGFSSERYIILLSRVFYGRLYPSNYCFIQQSNESELTSNPPTPTWNKEMFWVDMLFSVFVFTISLHHVISLSDRQEIWIFQVRPKKFSLPLPFLVNTLAFSLKVNELIWINQKKKKKSKNTSMNLALKPKQEIFL